MMKNLVVLTGAGISAESGLKTFRDNDGLWEGHDVMEVASIQGWHKNYQLVLDFYNTRYQQAKSAQPNKAHLLLVELEKYFNVNIVTQNVDDLHEKSGSSQVLHLHGMLNQCRSSLDPRLVYPMPENGITIGDKCEKGSQLRPNIVWFGEAVPMYDKAITLAAKADLFLVVGTSLQVYPAAGLVDEVKNNIPIYIIDKHLPSTSSSGNIRFIENKATEGMQILVDELKIQFKNKN